MKIAANHNAGETTPLLDTGLDRIVRVASATLRRAPGHWCWVVRCPFCGERHEHYAGPLDGDPYAYAGRIYAARCERTARRAWLLHAPATGLWYILEPAPLLSDTDADAPVSALPSA